MAFQVGQQVVCITDDWKHDSDPLKMPNVYNGQIYTIRKILDTGYIALCFEGVAGWYHQDGFRPVVKRKTDISALEEIARKASQRGLVDA